MKKAILMSCAAALVLAACSEASDDYASYETASADSAMTSSEAMADASSERASGALAPLDTRGELPATLPMIAYVFNYAFRLPGNDIAALTCARRRVPTPAASCR